MKETNPTPTQQETLEGCPLCACKVFKERFEKFSATTQGILGFSYRCPKCRSQFAVFGKSEAEAMTVWNTRAAVAGPRGDDLADLIQNYVNEVRERFVGKRDEMNKRTALAFMDELEQLLINHQINRHAPAATSSRTPAESVVVAGRVVNISTHGEPTRARLREIETSVSNGYEREYRKSGWSKALQFAIRDLHFLLTFFRDGRASTAPAGSTRVAAPSLTAAEKLPLPTDHECIAPSEQVLVINLLRGICGVDKQEAAQLHLNLCARCQELAGGTVPAESTRVAGEREMLRKEHQSNALGDRPHAMSAAKLRRLAMLEDGWQPIGTAQPDEELLLWSPPRQMSNDLNQGSDMRIAKPRDWTWATLWKPKPREPNLLTAAEADLVIGAIPLQALPSVAPATTTSDSARRAAGEIYDQLAWYADNNAIAMIAAIISKHFAASSPLFTEGNREEAIKLLRQLREAADPEEIQRQKESWAQLEAALNPTAKGDR